MGTCSYRHGMEVIEYEMRGEGAERKLIVTYKNEEWGASCSEVDIKRHGRDIDVTFVVGQSTGPSASLPILKEVGIPLPDEVHFLPDKNYKMKKVRFNVYTKEIGDPVGEAPKLRCCRELDYYVPAKIGWVERLWNRMKRRR